MPKKPIYRFLYFQVITAIIVGVLLHARGGIGMNADGRQARGLLTDRLPGFLSDPN